MRTGWEAAGEPFEPVGGVRDVILHLRTGGRLKKQEGKSKAKLSRTPPVAVRRQLRREVGFGCPVPECGDPYLEYHHFDPPWAVEKHHDPGRMIALCSKHHAQADAWTPQQVRSMKRLDRNRPEIKGRFQWMRHNVLAVIGSNFYYESPTMIQFNGRPIVWFNRDEDRHLLLNISMDVPGQPLRTSLTDNDWTIRGEPHNVESQPNGSQLSVNYADGDYLTIRFREHKSSESLIKVYPAMTRFTAKLEFPIVTAQVDLRIARLQIHLHATETVSPSFGVSMQGCFSNEGAVGLSIDRRSQPFYGT
jgi:hypothetical protein